jgi:LysR family transcriptional regulator, mexEF-oprN operon transcriptional activator
MQNINVADMRRIDLNLALVFVVIYEESSVTKAAERLYLTQPAISASLAKLRELTGNDLFVRQGRRLVPTPQADRLAQALAAGLSSLQAGFLEREGFVPRSASRTFRLGLLDDLEIGLLPGLVSQLRVKAPNVRVSVRTCDFRNAAAQFQEDQIDVAIGVFDALPSSLRRQTLLQTSFRCLYDPTQLKIGRALTMERWLELDHVLVSFSGDFHGLFEEKFARKGLRRKIVVATPRFAAIPYMLKGSPLVCTLPEYLAYRFAKSFGLATAAAPYEAGMFAIELVWPQRLDAEPDQLWFRGLLAKMLRMNILVGASQPSA